MDLEVTLIGNSITEEIVNELNNQNAKCRYNKVAHKGFALSPETIIIIVGLLQNIGYSAAYDLIKTSILLIISKLPLPSKKETEIIVINGKTKSKILLPFELTDEQKDKLVDAAIQKWRM